MPKTGDSCPAGGNHPSPGQSQWGSNLSLLVTPSKFCLEPCHTVTGAGPEAAAVRIATEPVTMNAPTLRAVPGRRATWGPGLAAVAKSFIWSGAEIRGTLKTGARKSGKHQEDQACSESSTEKRSAGWEDCWN